MNSENKMLIIFGQFLATFNALVNYKDGKSKLTFGKRAMELNVFNV